jgi:hypothetical protein
MFQIENGSARIEALGKPAEVVKTVDIPDIDLEIINRTVRGLAILLHTFSRQRMTCSSRIGLHSKMFRLISRKLPINSSAQAGGYSQTPATSRLRSPFSVPVCASLCQGE